MLVKPTKVLVIAPHPDDEVLGVGGTISEFSNNNIDVSVLIVSGHLPPLYDNKTFEVSKSEAEKSFKIMKVSNWKFLKIPSTTIHEIPVAKLNNEINNYLKLTNPDWVFLPFPDRHIDHRTVFESSVVCCRPNNKNFPRVVLAYETLSETHWNVPGIESSFIPDFFIDITKSIDKKKEALSCYQSQIENNESRSIEACEALAKFRGSQNGCGYAEAFKVIRIVI